MNIGTGLLIIGIVLVAVILAFILAICYAANRGDQMQMSEDDWHELDGLSHRERTPLMEDERMRLNELVEKSQRADEHPAWYEGPCKCRLCLRCLRYSAEDYAKNT